jgi:hypothetical protein
MGDERSWLVALAAEHLLVACGGDDEQASSVSGETSGPASGTDETGSGDGGGGSEEETADGGGASEEETGEVRLHVIGTLRIEGIICENEEADVAPEAPSGRLASSTPSTASERSP